MKKISVNMLSFANVVKGHGVETAYNELISILTKYGSKDLDIFVNKGINCDILHLHTPDPISFFKQRLTKNVTISYVHFLPNTLVGAINMPKKFLDIYAWWVKKIYLKSDYLVVVNPTYIDEMIKLGVNKDRIFYIPNIVSNEIFFVVSDKEKKQYRKKYGYKDDDFIVVSVGQLHKGKGVLDFISIAKKNPDIKFIWVGGFNFGNMMEGYKEIKEVYDNPPSNLRFTDVIDRNEVNMFCNMSDVFFLPSHYESFALVALEAAKTEKPIILRDLDTYKDIYFDNVLYGSNESEFINHIRSLKDDKYLYKKYLNKTKNIKKMYDEKEIYNKWLNLYKTIYEKNNKCGRIDK